MARYDLHPNTHEEEFSQDAVNTNKSVTVGLFDAVPIGKNKTLIAEILRVAWRLDPRGDANAREVEGELIDSVTEKTLDFAWLRADPNSGDCQSWAPHDLTDGQGHGVLLTKNPTLRLESAGFASLLARVSVLIFWRYVEVSNTELVQLLGGV